jgi:NAD(P)-dependent dehydrogenase (short-subunit alcohol dehydrogenase family)
MSKVILITGVSSGFGKESAELLAEKGHIVYGTIRKECNLNPNVRKLQMDLTDSFSIHNAVKKVIAEQGRIDVLINNAGMHLGGAIEETRVEDFTRQMNTNFNGIMHILQAALPIMRQKKQGIIINISSIGGLMGLPFQGVYSASKFALEGLSEALRIELRQFNIRVVVINPGDFHTNNTLSRTNHFVHGGPYDEQFNITSEVIASDENGGWHPGIMAKKIASIVDKKNPCNRYIVGSFEQKLAVYIKKVLPVGLFSYILASHYKVK